MALDAGRVEATLALDLDDRGFRDGDRKMAEWAQKDSSAQLSFDVNDRGFDAADRKLREWGLKSSTAELKFDVDRASLSRLLADAGGAGRAIDGVGTSADNAGGSLSSFGGTMQGLQWVGILAGAPAAAAALVNLGGAAVSVGSALSSLSGLLVTIPQGLLGFAQGAGTVAAATDGISEALKAYTTQQQNADKVTQAAASRDTSAAASRAAAARQVTTAQQQVADANRQVGTAERNLVVQHEAVTQAQHALNLAIEQAKRDMQDLKRQAIESATAEKQATLNLAEAQMALDKGLRDPHTSQLQIRQLRLSVVEARQAQTDAHINATRAQEDHTQAQREGVSGQPSVVAAHQAVTAAIRAEADAHRQLEDAQRGVARATANLNYQQEQAKLHIEQSQQSMAQAATTANVYQQALEQLTPAQRQFTRFLVETREKVEHLRNVAAKNLFPGVEQGISEAMKNFPRIRRIVGETAQVLGHLASQVGKFLGSKQFGRDLTLFAHTNLKLFEDLGRAGLHFAHGLEIILRDAQPFIRWLGRLTEKLGQAFNSWARTGHQTGAFTSFFRETRRTLPEVLHLIGNLFSLLTGIGEAAAPVGNKILQFFNRSLRAWAEWSHSIVGQVELRAFFERLRVPFEDLLRLVAALSGAFLDLFGSTRGQHMLDELTKGLIAMIPPVERIGETVVEIITILGPSLLDVLNSFLEIIADGAPELEIFAKALAFFADKLVDLLDAVPGLKELVGTIAAWGLAMAGVKWAVAASGLKDLGEGLYNVFKSGGLIEQAPGKVSAFMDAVTAFPANVKAQAGRIVAATKEVFLRIGSRLGLITGERIAVDTVGGEVAGEAGGGLIGRMKGLMGRLRGRLGTIFRSLGTFLGLRVGEQVAVTTVEGAAAGEAGGVAAGGIIGRMRGLMGRLRGRLGTMFKALASFLGIRMGEQIALTTVEGSAAGEAAGGLLGGLRSRIPRMSTALGAIGKTLGIAFGTALVAAALYEFGKKFDTGLPGALGLAFPTKTGQTSTEEYQQTLQGYGFHTLGLDAKFDYIRFQGHTLRIPAGATVPNLTALQNDPRAARRFINRYEYHGRGYGGQRGGLVTEAGIVGFAGGGIAGARMQPPGPTDTVPAMLTPGEIVLPRKASQAIQNAVGPITQGTEKATKAILKLIRRDVSASYSGVLSDVADAEDKLTKGNRDTWQKVHKDTNDEIGERQGQNNTFWGDVTDAIEGAGDTWDQVTAKMLNQTQTRFASIAQTAQRRGSDFSGYVRDAMRTASEATYTGTNYIADAVSKALKAFDSKEKFTLHVDKPSLQGHAQGGMIGGQGRQDTIPLLLGMAAPGEAILTRYQQAWVDTALRNTFGMGLGDLFATERRPHGFAKGGQIGGPDFAFPLPKGTPFGRTDQGVDFGGTGPLGAIGDAEIVHIGNLFSGFGPPDGGVVYRMLAGAPKGFGPTSDLVFNFEDLHPNVHVGQRVRAGQQIATRIAGSSGIEIGFARDTIGEPLTPYNGAPDGTPMPAGKAMLAFLHALAGGKSVTAGAAATAMRLIGALDVKGTAGPMRDLVTAALEMSRGAGNDFIRRESEKSAALTGGMGSLQIPKAAGSLAERAATIARKLKAPHRAALALFEALWAESTMGTASSNVLQLIPQTAASAGIGLSDADAQISSFLENAYGFGPGAITLAKTTSEPAYAIAQDIQGSGAGQSSGGLSNYGAQQARATASLHQLGYPSFREGGFIGRLESRLRHLTRIPAIRHLQDRIRKIQAEIRGQTRRLQDLPRKALRGDRGQALRKAIHGEQHLARQIQTHMNALHRHARDAAPQIHHLDSRLLGRLMPMFSRAEHMAEMGHDPSALMRHLHVGRALGSPALRTFARSQTSSIRNALAISRAQAPSLGGGSIFAQGGFLGNGLGLTNVSGGAQGAPIYLMLDADVASFVGRVRAVQNGREVELGRKAGLSRLTPGSIGRKAVYAVPRR